MHTLISLLILLQKIITTEKDIAGTVKYLIRPKRFTAFTYFGVDLYIDDCTKPANIFDTNNGT